MRDVVGAWVPVHGKQHRDSTFNTPFIEVFMLLAGETYTLEAISSGDGFGTPMSGRWDFTMTPEPGSGVLVSIGLAGLAARRRTRR